MEETSTNFVQSYIENPDVWAVAVALVALVFTIWYSAQQSKSLTQQLRLNFFSDYTKRYQEIMLNFPENINEDGFSYESLSQETRNKTLRYMRAYFDLCSEEYYLWENKHVDHLVCKLWKRGIRMALSKKAFKEAWERISNDTNYDREFIDWMNDSGKKKSK